MVINIKSVSSFSAKMYNNSEKFILITIPQFSVGEKRKASNLRRYLINHSIKYKNFASRKLIVHHLSKSEAGNESSPSDDDEDDDQDMDIDSDIPDGEKNENDIIKVGSNQELLENWARNTFEKNSDEYNLFFGKRTAKKEHFLIFDNDYQLYTEETTVQLEKQPEKLKNSSIDSSGSLSSENDDNSTVDEKVKDLFKSDARGYPIINDEEDEEDHPDNNFSNNAYQDCKLCQKKIYVGKAFRTKIRAFSRHLMEDHRNESFGNISPSRRYKCTGCSRILPVYETPCSHINNYHITDDKEIEFIDLWSTNERESFDNIFYDCFKRRVPVPRGRRLRQSDVFQKVSYKIRSGNTITEKKTIEEKCHKVDLCPPTTSEEQNLDQSKVNENVNNECNNNFEI